MGNSGFSMGQRMVDEFLAKSDIDSCSSFEKMAENVREGVKYFLGVKVDVKIAKESLSFSLILPENPLTDFVEIPENLTGIIYSNIIAGALRGALEIVKRLSCPIGNKLDVLLGVLD